MKEIYYCKIAESGSGLCNQLFALVTGILLALQKGRKIVIVDSFSNDYSTNSRTRVSDVINLDKLNIFLKSNYNIIVLDRHNINVTIKTVKYGIDGNYIDITNTIKDKYYKNNLFCINTNVNLNNIAQRDPLIGQQKQLELTYSVNDILLKESYEEINGFLKTKIEFNLQNTNFIHVMGWINHIDRCKFDNILKNIHFVKKYDIPDNENKIIAQCKKINVIHLRLEDDAITHWSRQNNMSPTFFKNIIERKYINIIYKHINKNDMNIILTYSTQNSVIDFLKKNDYNYHISSKIHEWGRELNAIKDTNMIYLCNNLFIGNFNLENLNGSSLSYFLLNNIKKTNIKSILIDLDKILVTENVVTK